MFLTIQMWSRIVLQLPDQEATYDPHEVAHPH